MLSQQEREARMLRAMLEMELWAEALKKRDREQARSLWNLSEWVRAGVDLGEPIRDGKPLLRWAAERRELSAVEDLLAAGAPVNQQDERAGATALLGALQWKARGEESKLLRTVELLLDAGGDPSQGRGRGPTPLMAAIDWEGPIAGRLCESLIQAGAEVGAVNEAGMDALMIAAMLGVEQAVDKLIKAGARLDTRMGEDGAASLARLHGHEELAERLSAIEASQSERAELDRIQCGEAKADRPKRI